MTTGYIAPQAAVNEKTTQQSFTYHNGRWAIQCNDDLYLEMPVSTFGTQEGWGDGSTQNTVKKSSTGWSNKVNEIGYNVAGDVWQVFSRSVAGGGIRYHTTPYTPGSDTYGTTTVTRIDSSGDNWNSSGFDSGQCAFITDQQGNPLFFAIGSSSDAGTLSPKDGILVGYDPLDSPTQAHAQIEAGFNRASNTNADPFIFNDGTSDYVGVVYSDGTNFKLAYHVTETTPSNYSTGWVVESIGVPASDSVDDHICARSFDGSLYAVVKGGAGVKGYLITTTGGIDTLTNSTTFLFTEIQDNCSRPVICINESSEEMHIAYEQGGSPSTINLKSQPLSGFSFTPSDIGTLFMENGTDDMENPTPPAHNVTSDMEFLPFLCENNTLNSTWHNRIDISAALVVDITTTEVLSSFTDSSTINIETNVSLSITEVLSPFSDSSTVNLTPSISVDLAVTEVLNSFSDSSTITIVEAGNVALNVTEILNAFTDSSVINLSANVNINVTEVLNSFLDGSNVTIAKDVMVSVTEVFASFNDNSSVKLPANWNDKPTAVTNYTVQTPVSTIWIDKG